MLNPKTTSKNQRNSKFLGNRRKRFLTQSKKELLILPEVPNVSLKDKKADIFCKMFREGFFRVKFISKENGRSAFGYGETIEIAFVNMTRNFNEKYNGHERAIN